MRWNKHRFPPEASGTVPYDNLPVAFGIGSKRFGDALAARSLVAADVVSLATSFLISEILLRSAAIAGHVEVQLWISNFAGASVCFLLTVAILGLYPGRGIPGPERVKRRVVAAAIALVVASVMSAVAAGSSAALMHSIVAMGILAFLSPFLEMVAIAVLDRAGFWRCPAVFRGPPDQLEQLSTYMSLFPELGFQVVSRAETPSPVGDVTIVEPLEVDDGRQIWNIEALAYSFPSLRPRDSAQMPLQPRGHDRLATVLKRAMDLTIVALAAVPACVLIGIVAPFIMIKDGRPLFYAQQRRGLGGKQIKVWKLRSMYRNSDERLAAYLAANPSAREEWETHFKLAEDPRILPKIGNLIRSLSLDEIPQLWNVMRGEMSVIGPRPFPDYHLAAFSDEFRQIRSRVPPGLSGLWQVTMRSDANLFWQEKLDRTYIESWSLWVDLYILLRTPIALLSGRGAH